MSKGWIGLLLLIVGMTSGLWLPDAVPLSASIVLAFLIGVPAGVLLFGAAMERWG